MAASGLIGTTALAQNPVGPLEIHQGEVLYNLQSMRGVPLSTNVYTVSSLPNGTGVTTNYVVGVTNKVANGTNFITGPTSDGRLLTPNDYASRGYTNAPATVHQFQALVSFGGLGMPFQPGQNANTNVNFLNPTASLAASAQVIGLPVGLSNGVVTWVFKRSAVGAPYISQSVSYKFGAIIPPPTTDERGTQLAVLPGSPRAEDYWLAEPYTTNAHVSDLFYWSPHAQSVFATKTGQIPVTWRRSYPYIGLFNGGVPADAGTVNGVAKGLGAIAYSYDGASYYPLYTKSYLVSGSPITTPRKIYWTQGGFADTGVPVQVPSALVSQVNVAYNKDFPTNTLHEYSAPGVVPIVNPATNHFEELRTLWYDPQQRSIYAYNVEGRVFVEFLGDKNADGITRHFLGFEIVDVYQQPNPQDVVTDLGDRLNAWPDGHDDSALNPQTIPSLTSASFLYRQTDANGSGRTTFFAVKETINQNDVVLHWLEQGILGLRWPYIFDRYKLRWPVDIAKYSHYIRPVATNDAEAQATAIPLPTDSAPNIAYQDSLPFPFGAHLTPDFKFYTFLNGATPAHRSLLQYSLNNNVFFERVFSWTDSSLVSSPIPQPILTNLPSGSTNASSALYARFGGSVATNLTCFYNTTNGGVLVLPNDGTSPRVVNLTALVGHRIDPPWNETGSVGGTNYLAGYIRQSAGTAFSYSAYIDPLVSGIAAANAGAIIPVNANPVANSKLEVWWFRTNAPPVTNGFTSVYWPSVIGRYALQWPLGADQIVLASNSGTTPLTGLEAKGRVYYQNDSTQPGYNPNEEHALMLGGAAWALRDDLNVTNADLNYTSHPFVLVEYADSDGRPNLTPYQVVRERPDLGQTFTFDVRAGDPIKPPMPLIVLDQPLVPNSTIGAPPISLNHEVGSMNVLSSAVSLVASVYNTYTTNVVFGGIVPITTVTTTPHTGTIEVVTFSTAERHPFPINQRIAVSDTLQNPPTNLLLFVTSPNSADRWVAGVPSLLQPVTLTPWGHSQSGYTDRWRYGIADLSALSTGQIVEIADSSSGNNWVGFVAQFGREGNDSYVDLSFGGAVTVPSGALVADKLVIPFNGFNPGTGQNWTLSFNALPTNFPTANLTALYEGFTFQDRKGQVWAYRGPHSESENALTGLRFYYKTLPGFWFPGQSIQPPVGTITPYLRFWSPVSNQFQGDPVYGAAKAPLVGDDNALVIHYRPVWPTDAPVLDMAQTLTKPTKGLPDVRGNSSLQVLYQQSLVAGGASNPSVVLHDPTRAKKYVLGPVAASQSTLGAIPGSVKTQSYLGKTYFPNLPPHLANRFFFDPTVGPVGALVFEGQYITEGVLQPYLLLNVLSQSDIGYLLGLCSSDDPLAGAWKTAITDSTAGLTTAMQVFIPDSKKIGSFTAAPFVTTVGPSAIAEVTDENMAVDSYALTAVGPGTGFVTLVEGNGIAFTRPDDPVALKVVRVVRDLYPGRLNVVQSSNPLGEKISLQQVVDLAGKADQYNFQWLVAAPVDGGPPPLYRQVPTTLLASGGTWNHLIFPATFDSPASVHQLLTNAPIRVIANVRGTVVPVNAVTFSSVSSVTNGVFTFSGLNATDAVASALVIGNHVTLRDTNAVSAFGSVIGRTGSGGIQVSLDPGQLNIPPGFSPAIMFGSATNHGTQAMIFKSFTSQPTNYTDLWLSVSVGQSLPYQVYLDGTLVTNQPSSLPSDLASVPGAQSFSIDPSALAAGSPNSDGSSTHQLVIAIATPSPVVPGASFFFDANVQGHVLGDITQTAESQWLPLDPIRYPDGIRAVLGGTADVRALSDNWLIMRYQAANRSHASWISDPKGATKNINWSQWTPPQLVEGWIKRVLAGINPFNQRSADLFNNAVNTDGSLLTEAGPRWEGDVALNLDTINDYGLIEIYETILRRGRVLSIDGGINYGPANDALLLAAGYISDLYTILGNEAWADANNPTISIGTKDSTYGNIATALFPFLGQTATLIEQQQDMLRGRDDFAQPGVNLAPVYNRLYWNYTRGINSGEVIYALNYDIHPKPGNQTGSISANDAKYAFPQGHGDAYGHYLTALTGYYGLLMSPNFSWIPEFEAVTILGAPVQVGYVHERKFAASAAALARTGNLIFDLAWRSSYVPGRNSGWGYLTDGRVNNATAGQIRTRYWGPDQWATRIGQAAYVNWMVGNALLPAVDPDRTHQGIQKIDRTTVPELQELPSTADAVQNGLDNAEGGLNPLGLPENAVAFDINPLLVTSSSPQTHFEQVFDRATAALNNAVVAFDDATTVTRTMRSQSDSLADFQNQVQSQEVAYTNRLIEIFGTPYSDDIGPGQTYPQGFAGPDLFHYMYVDNVDVPGTSNELADPQTQQQYSIDLQGLPSNWYDANNLPQSYNLSIPHTDPSYASNPSLVYTYNLGPRGYAEKPSNWTGSRNSPGQLQQAISDIIDSYNQLELALENMAFAKLDLDKAVDLFKAKVAEHNAEEDIKITEYTLKTTIDAISAATDIRERFVNDTKSVADQQAQIFKDALPQSLIFGLADGGDELAPARAAIEAAQAVTDAVFKGLDFGLFTGFTLFKLANDKLTSGFDTFTIPNLQWELQLKQDVNALGAQLNNFDNYIFTINGKAGALDSARRKYQSLVAQADRLLAERLVFRQRAATVIQGYRSRDAAFRMFRDEKLERYTTLFDLASRYALLAANAYDYETGLLDSDRGRQFVQKIVSSRALGVIQNGLPRYAGSNTGDPGLSSALAEMKADFDSLKGRLGFNNPDGYGTVASLRAEKYRILDGTEGDSNWQDLLNRSRMANILNDADVARNCLQIDPGGGLPVPGIVIEFSTTIADGYNLFGQPLAVGDHAYSPSSYATKIFGVGVVLDGYLGMDAPLGSGAISPGSGAQSPDGLAADPYVYLIPVGADSMRTPPLGDTSTVRAWEVADVAIPMPFNIGGSDYSTKPLWQSSDSLSEPMFAVRKHQGFRAVPTTSAFASVASNPLQRTQYTNERLIGRSVWNSKWKLVIPGRTLLNDPNDGLDRFIRTVKDVKLYFQTYSYAGN